MYQVFRLCPACCLQYAKMYPKLMKVVGCVDASWAVKVCAGDDGEVKLKSRMGVLVELWQSGVHLALIFWKSKTIKRVWNSSTTAELHAFNEGCALTLFVRGQLEELLGWKPPMLIETDSVNVEALVPLMLVR